MPDPGPDPDLRGGKRSSPEKRGGGKDQGGEKLGSARGTGGQLLGARGWSPAVPTPGPAPVASPIVYTSTHSAICTPTHSVLHSLA